jgi:hypothetical protein
MESDIGRKPIPMYGYSQPTDGGISDLICDGMPKEPKGHKPVSRAAILLRDRVAENVMVLMSRRFPARDPRYSTESKRQKALAKEAGCSWSTIQRVLAPNNFAKIDTLADLAVVFGVSAADLLTPNFANNTIGVHPRSEEETRELQRRSGSSAA